MAVGVRPGSNSLSILEGSVGAAIVSDAPLMKGSPSGHHLQEGSRSSLAKPKCINGRALIPETAVVPPLPSIRRAISLPILMTWKWYFRRVQLRLR
ncbi:unnamed protein product [Penicillium salamii]|nr:unnamed protein product [Penicillium salamii]